MRGMFRRVAAPLAALMCAGLIGAGGAQGQEDDAAFYTPPSPLPQGKPGDLIKARDIATGLVPGARVQQIMYLSKDQSGDLVPVTGALYTPVGQSGSENPLVVHTPGTRGLADKCAPSRQANMLQSNPDSAEYSVLEYTQFVAAGVSVVVTDYKGQGTPGLPEYLVGRSEGQNGLDAVRAVQRMSNSGISARSPIGVSGYSQGGQASAWVAELQPEYAPELKFKGALVGGPVTDMNLQVGHLNGNPTAGAGFALASLLGLNEAYPELNLESRLTEQGKSVLKRIEDECVAEYIGTFGNTKVADVTSPDVLNDPEWRKRFAESTLGTKPPGAPAYIYHGQADTIVPYVSGQGLYRDWCQQGASVIFEPITGVEHLSGIFVGPQRGVNWLIGRLNGAPADPPCGQPPASTARVKSKLYANAVSKTGRAFTVRGRLALPKGTAKATGCKGRIAIKITRGGEVVASRRIAVRKDCTFSARRTFARQLSRSGGKLQFELRFRGNTAVEKSAIVRNVRIGKRRS